MSMYWHSIFLICRQSYLNVKKLSYFNAVFLIGLKLSMLHLMLKDRIPHRTDHANSLIFRIHFGKIFFLISPHIFISIFDFSLWFIKRFYLRTNDMPKNVYSKVSVFIAKIRMVNLEIFFGVKYKSSLKFTVVY